MDEFVGLLALLLVCYMTLGIMAIGFAVMVRGANGARAAARLFFLLPVVYVIKKSWRLFVATLRWLLGMPPKKK